MECTIMDTHQQNVLDYLLSSEKDRVYNFERGKPISNKLITKYSTKQTDYGLQKYELKEKRSIAWVDLDRNKALAQAFKRDTKQPPLTNNLLSKSMPIHIQSPTAGLRALKQFKAC